MMSFINVRDPDTLVWSNDAYEFDQEKKDNLVLVWGRENVRVLSGEEWERTRVRKRQDEEMKESAPPKKKRKRSLPTIEELRALRVAYYERKFTKAQSRL